MKCIEKISDFSIKYRYLLLGLFFLIFIFTFLNINNVKINNNIINYLPDNTETKKGLTLMNDEFGSFTSISLMVKDVNDYKKIYSKLENIKNIENVSYSLKDNNALYILQIRDANEDKMVDTTYEIKKIVSDSDYYLYSSYYSGVLDGIDRILIMSVCIIFIILLITSKSYFEVFITFIIFIFAIVLNMGTNFIFKEVSYITESIAVILQLALSIDYVIIYMNEFMKSKGKTLERIKITSTKAIKEILASSLTTISGLLALVFMKLKIGKDIGLVLTKGIISSLITVIFLMPALLVIFNKILIKTEKKKKNKINFKVINSKLLLSIYILIVIISAVLIPKYKYVYNIYSIEAISQSDNTKALHEIENVFGKTNTLAVIVKSDKDYNKELKLKEELDKISEVTLVTSVGSYEISDNIYITSDVNYKELKEILKKYAVVDGDKLIDLYKHYAYKNNDAITNIDDYKIKIIDLIYFLKENEDNLSLNSDLRFKLDVGYAKITDSIRLLESDNYSRFILTLDMPIESNKSKEVVDEIRSITNKYYSDVTLVGNTISSIDLEKTFTKDNIIITLITILFIYIILYQTFKNKILSLILILTIEGSILITFALSVIFNMKIFFMSYLVVSAIQMGATIDYAIVFASRYLENRCKYDKDKSINLTMKDRIGAILTSGLILTISGFIVGFVSTSSVISSIGLFLGIGTLISLITTIFILPTILYIFDKYIIYK